MERWQRSLDNYITSGQCHKEVHSFCCPNCGLKAEVDMDCEYGMCEPVIEGEDFCPDCNIEMESQ